MELVRNATPQQLYPQKCSTIPLVQEAGRAPGSIGTGDQQLKYTALQRNPIVQN